MWYSNIYKHNLYIPIKEKQIKTKSKATYPTLSPRERIKRRNENKKKNKQSNGFYLGFHTTEGKRKCDFRSKTKKKNALSRTSSPLVNGNHHVTRRNRRNLTFRHLLHTLLTLVVVVVVICQIGIASRGVPKNWGLYQKCIKNTHTHTHIHWKQKLLCLTLL